MTPWIFEQLHGPRKRFVLAGAQAPHGRRRQEPVVVETQASRTKTTLYPDGQGRKTRHVFGLEREPVELSGRFMDRDLGVGGAEAKAAELKSFHADQVNVRVTWGGSYAVEGFIDKIDLKREAKSDIAYTIKVDVDDDCLSAKRTRPPSALLSPAATMQKLYADLSAYVVPMVRPQGPAIPVNYLDKLESVVDAVTGSFAKLVGLTNDFDDFVSATGAQVDRLIAGIRAGRTALLNLRETYTSAQLEVNGVTQSASDLAFGEANQLSMDQTMLTVLAELARTERDAQAARRGRLTKRYVAADGDTWEGISVRFYADPDRGDVIRDANGVLYGDLPVAGRTYVIPSA